MKVVTSGGAQAEQKNRVQVSTGSLRESYRDQVELFKAELWGLKANFEEELAAVKVRLDKVELELKMSWWQKFKRFFRSK